MTSKDQRRQDVLRGFATALREFRRAGERSRDWNAKRLGMHPTDYSCLTYLHLHGPAAPRDIIAHLGLTSGSGTALFDRLEREGYLTRKPNPADRRSLLIEICPERAAPIIASLGELETLLQDAFGTYTDAEVDVISRFFKSLREISDVMDRNSSD